jgi:hypothetical protein
MKKELETTQKETNLVRSLEVKSKEFEETLKLKVVSLNPILKLDLNVIIIRKLSYQKQIN